MRVLVYLNLIYFELNCPSICLSKAFISETLGDIELKFKPYTQIYGPMFS